MKNAHPIISATASSPVGPDSTGPGEPAEPIIRLKLQKPLHWEWELTTSADALPVIQLLDKDGRLLVETTGKTAQRARGSFKEGLRTHEQFPVDVSAGSRTTEQPSSTSTTSSSVPSYAASLHGNRNIDGFSSKFGSCNFAPRKSRSDVSIKERKKRLSSAVDDSRTWAGNVGRNVEGATGSFKRYSAGDYLRQQIVDDLRTRSTIGKTQEEIAKDRCRKVKAYLRSRSETLLGLVREEERGADETKNTESRTLGRNAGNRRSKKSEDTTEMRVSPEEKDESKKVKSYLRTRSALLPTTEDSVRGSKPSEGDRVVRKIKDDTDEEELAKIRVFLREKIQRRMNMEQTRSGSAVSVGAPETIENTGIKKRYSDYGHENDRRNYKTRKVRSETSIVRFDPEVLERERLKSSGEQLEKERPTNCGESSEESQLQGQLRKNCRRARSEVLIETKEPDDRTGSRLPRESSSLERRKFYRKTKSDVFLGQAAANADPVKDLGNPPRRIKSQESVERSWREYRERRRSERHCKGPEREMPEEDFMNKPRWKDLQRDLCSSRNCKVCQNLRNCVDPFHERADEAPGNRQEGEIKLPSTRKKTAAKALDGKASPADSSGGGSGSSSSSRPGTSLQENYLLVEEYAQDRCQSPIIARIQVRDRGNDIGGVSASSINSPDFGYNSIPKSALKNYRELYARSNVKKSDTFKIVDGSEDLVERAILSDPKIHGDISDYDLGYLNGEGSLANKSNEDIAKDYFKRVYELLKRRQEETRKSMDVGREFPGHDDSSSSNYVEEMQRKRHRNRRRERSPQEDAQANNVTANGATAIISSRRNPSRADAQSSQILLGCQRDDLETARLQIEEKNATIECLKDQLKSERKAACDKMTSQRRCHVTKVRETENKYRTIVKRHQKFIEQLIAEKTVLTKKCDALAQRINETEQKIQRDMRVIADRHAVELQRAKENIAASEKIRRERWLEMKTSKIKEMTVKGLEPELHNMMEQHQREIQELRRAHIKELQDAELRTLRRSNQQLEQLRIELTDSHEKMLAREKDILVARYEEKLEKQETHFQTLQKTLTEHFERDKSNLLAEQTKRDQEANAMMQQTQLRFQKEMDTLKEQHETSKMNFEEFLRKEWLVWADNHKKQQNASITRAEATIRSDCQKERDRQIEIAIARLEKESRDMRAKLQQNFDNKLELMKEEYDAKLQSAIKSENIHKNNLLLLEERLTSTEVQFEKTESKLKECMSNLSNMNQTIAKLTVERDNAKEIARQEIEMEKRELEDKIASLYQEITQNNANRDQLMAQLHSRIKLVITKKVLIIKDLNKKLSDANSKCEHLEKLLDQQRKEYILKTL